MSDQTCACGTPTRDNAYVCDGCLDKLTHALAETPWLDGELATTIGQQRGIDYRGLGGSPSSETPAPVNVAALEARRAYRHALVTAIRFCNEEHVRHQSANSRQPVDNLASMSRWLMWRVDGLAFNDMGGEFVAEVVDGFGRCRRMVDSRPERRYAGPCECGRDLYHKPGAVTVKCRDCEREYDSAELYAWMKSQVMGRLVTAHEGSLLLCKFELETPKRVIYGWEERGRISAHGCNPVGKRLFLIDDLLALAAERSA